MLSPAPLAMAAHTARKAGQIPGAGVNLYHDDPTSRIAQFRRLRDAAGFPGDGVCRPDAVSLFCRLPSAAKMAM